ncbi:ABC transporter substrate-binding protein [Desulfobacterales bacterium HSG2]|nr:ABC transporter substrate-binding protein [Desulfobacterales bacterium HSG2]
MKNVCVKMMMCLLIMAICSGQGIAKEPLQPVTIQLDWVANVAFAGILVAKDRGWYQETGIDLTIREAESGLSTIDAVLAGKAQIGVAEGAEIIEARVKGQKVRAVAAHFQKSPYCLISKKSSGITAPDQLAGKRIGISPYDITLMLKIVLANQAVAFKDIVLVRVENFQPLVDDEIDVCQGYMSNELLTLRQQGHKVAYIPAFKYGYDFYSSVCFVTDAMIQKHPELIRKFLEVSLRGWEEAFKNPAATAQVVVEKYYPEGSVPHETESLKMLELVARLAEGRKRLGWMEEEYWAKGIDILHKFKQTDRKIPATDVFTLKFLESVYFKK